MIKINEQVISRERVSSHGEVFTAEREVKAMCDLVAEQCRDISATFLEPACGTGNFLVEILSRKLEAITDNHERNALIALSSLYGIDIQPDNIDTCRKRLYDIWTSWHDFSTSAKTIARRILEANIVQGDTLKPETITLTEWTFTETIIPTAKTFTLSSLIEGNEQLAFSFPE